VEHLVCGCSYLAGQQYKHRHDEVVKYVHWLLCKRYELEYDSVWWRHSPLSVQESAEVKLLWDFNIFTDKVITARRPDITLIHKLEGLVKFIDIAVPSDKRVHDKEN